SDLAGLRREALRLDPEPVAEVLRRLPVLGLPAAPVLSRRLGGRFQEQLLGLLVSDHLAQIGYGRESGGQRGRRRRDGRSRVETGAGDGALLRFAEEDEEDGDRG